MTDQIIDYSILAFMFLMLVVAVWVVIDDAIDRRNGGCENDID